LAVHDLDIVIKKIPPSFRARLLRFRMVALDQPLCAVALVWLRCVNRALDRGWGGACVRDWARRRLAPFLRQKLRYGAVAGCALEMCDKFWSQGAL
jgi:hypothetical protein